MKLTKEQEVEIFKALATYPITKVGYKFELDKRYTNINTMRNFVITIKNKIAANPSAWNVSQETVDMVKKAMDERRVDHSNGTDVLIAEREALKKENSNIIQNVRDNAWELINRKINMIGKSRKMLRETTLQQLGTIAGIAFDKVQIMKGEATENIAVRAKIDKNLNPDDLLKLVLKQREDVNESNNK